MRMKQEGMQASPSATEQPILAEPAGRVMLTSGKDRQKSGMLQTWSRKGLLVLWWLTITYDL